MIIAGLETHPAADLFPMMEAADIQALADDIRMNGLRNPIVRYQGQILDGRNRLQACLLASVEPKYITWAAVPGRSPTAYVVSQNLHRRHLDASQRAMVAADLVPMFEAEARERQRIGGAEKGGATWREAEKGKATEKAAEVTGSSTRSVERAVKVKKEAPPEVVEAVKAGQVSVAAAEKSTRATAKSTRATAKRPPDAGPRRHRPGSNKHQDPIPVSIPHGLRSIKRFARFLTNRLKPADRRLLARLLLDHDPPGDEQDEKSSTSERAARRNP